MAILILPAAIIEQSGISSGAPGDIPVRDQEDLARVGTGVVYGGSGTIEAKVGGVDIGPSPASVPDDVTVEFAATPDPGWKVKGWYVNGIAEGITSETYSLTITSSDVTVQVLFEQIFTLTYGVYGGTGTIEAKINGVYFGLTPVSVKDGDTVFLMATPDPGWRVKDWYLNGAATDSISSAFSCTIAGSDVTIQVQFEMIPSPGQTVKVYQITASSDKGATISPNGAVGVLRGYDKTFFFEPEDGYLIIEVRIDGVFLLSSAQIDLGYYTFDHLMEDHTIEVKTTAGSRAGNLLRIDVLQGEGFAMYNMGSGFVIYTEPVKIPAGTNITVRAIAGSGFVFDRWETPKTERTLLYSVEDIRGSLHFELFFNVYVPPPSDDGAQKGIALLILAGLLLLFFLLWYRAGLHLTIVMGEPVKDASVTYMVEKEGNTTEDIRVSNKKGICRIPAKKGSTVTITMAEKYGITSAELPMVVVMEKRREIREIILK